MKRLAGIIGGLLVIVVIALAFCWTFIWWTGLSGARADEVLLLYAAATAILGGLFMAGLLIPVRGHAYYIIAGATVFLAVDFIVWWRTGITPAARFVRGGFVPAAIMGMVLGPVFRAFALHGPPAPDLR